MSKAFGNNSAFPIQTSSDTSTEGLSKLEYFAAHAPEECFQIESHISVLEADLGLLPGTYNYIEHYPMVMAKRSVAYARGLIEELNKDKKE